MLPYFIFLCAFTGVVIDQLLDSIAAALPHPDVELELLVPYDRGDLVALAHARARVIETRYDERGTWLTLMATQRVAEQLKAAVTAGAPATA